MLVGAAISVPLAILAHHVGRITLGGAALGVIFAAVIHAAFYLAGLTVLGVALAATIAASRVAGKKGNAGAATDDHEIRGTGNIMANCLVGTLGAAAELSGYGLGSQANAIWFVCGIAAGASDTVASEIGRAWGGAPRTFPTWNMVPPGTPGAVSAIGTFAGIAASALIAAPAWVLWLLPLASMLPLIVGCAAGSIVESALSTRFERAGWLDNNTLNLLNTAFSAGIAVGWTLLSTP